ncbi:MAG: RtcB family protein [Erysipelotrichaceae bacterium]|nr:RtcB family protein [Erysipelotrichaceae bacterium]
MFEIKGKYNTAQVFATTVENECVAQIIELCNQHWLKGCHIAIMPDCHAGSGCTIGTTMTLKDKVSPSLVGVDISCGMLCIEIPEILKLDLAAIDAFINEYIPAGFEANEELFNDIDYSFLEALYCYDDILHMTRAKKSLGSLGGGNHFIELNESSDGKHYIVIHSGSRNLGKQVAEIYQDKADEHCNHGREKRLAKRNNIIDTLKAQGRTKEIQSSLERFDSEYEEEKLIPHDLCYIEGKDMNDYFHDCKICNQYASLSRMMMAKRILQFIVENNGYTHCQIWLKEIQKHQYEFGFRNYDVHIISHGFETIHNYIGDDHILRKGAISAKKGEKVIIPINMRDGSIIGIGKGNPDYNQSGPHGAGRIMSRGKARHVVDFENYKQSMKDVYSSSVVESTIDESPMVYKNIDEIIENISDSVEIIDIIKPIYNFKAH